MVATQEREMSSREISRVLSRASIDFRPIQLRARIRRALINRDLNASLNSNYVGTMLPVPFDKSALAIKTMIGHPAEAVQYYASRFASNPPTVEVMPLTVKDEVSDTLDKLAGKQELFDALLLDSMGIGAEKRANHRKCAYAQAVTEAAYYVLQPADHAFGMPERSYYSDEEADFLRSEGKKIGPVRTERGWPEHADSWNARKQSTAKNRAISAQGYFDLQCYPRDMVMKGRDSAGLKWAAVVEHIPADECGPGSDLAMSWARKNGKPEDDVSMWGLWRDSNGKIIGGLERGGPAGGNNRQGDWTLIRFFTRIEVVYLLTSGNALDGGQEVYRCRHGATDEGRPIVPVFEVPAMRTDIETMGQEFIGPMSQVFAYAPLVNQLETLFSAAAVWNTAPRYYILLPDGTVLRDDNGEPKFFDSAPVPGTDAGQIGAYIGEIHQLKIDTTTIEALLPIYLEQIAEAMPSKSATGDAGSSSAAWLAQQNIQQAQLTIEEPVANHREAVGQILRVCHDYLRPLDTDLYFFPYPTAVSAGRQGRGLVEFSPGDLTDSFVVQQDLTTADERTVLLQIGNELAGLGRINDRTYFSDYYKASDAREAIINQWQQRFVNAYLQGPASGIAPDSGLGEFVMQVRGKVEYAQAENNPVFALGKARQMASAAAQSVQQPPDAGGGMGGGVADAAGIRRPGMGLAPTLTQQLGDQAQPAVNPTPGAS